MNSPNSNKTKIDQFSDLTNQINQSSRGSSWITAKDLCASFKYAFHGISYSFKSQRNFRIHIFLGSVAIFATILFDLSVLHLAIIVFTVASVLILELINTSIEAVVDLTIGRRFHPLARIAKDCAAASVLVASISSLLIAILLILIPIIKRFSL